MPTLDEQIEALTKRLDEADRRPLVAEVAKAKGVPDRLAKRLEGSTRAELEADADKLLGLIGKDDGDDDDKDDDGFDAQKVADAVGRVGRGAAADEETDKVVDRVRRGY